jgi:two-component system response regulator (stage 0 sporulation protein F)
MKSLNAWKVDMADNFEKEPRDKRDKILVVDDSPIIREMLIEILTDDGYIVETAQNGEEGAAMALQEEYAVILCDVHMPRQNGLETVREIITAKPDSKIIMTDSFPDKLAQSARNEGAVCCLQKPFDVKELRQLINQVKSGSIITIGQ